MKSSTLKSAPLMCGAILATICVVAEPTEAVPTVMNLHSATNVGGGDYSIFDGPHTFGGTTTFGSAFPIHISSGLSTRIGWQFEMTVDYSDYDIGFFGPTARQIHDILDIKQPGAVDLVSDFRVKKADGSPYGSLSPDSGIINGGTGIHVNVAASEILAAPGQLMIIQWNQVVPGPGAMALLGMAGVVGGRGRRRRHN